MGLVDEDNEMKNDFEMYLSLSEKSSFYSTTLLFCWAMSQDRNYLWHQKKTFPLRAQMATSFPLRWNELAMAMGEGRVVKHHYQEEENN